MHPPIIYKPTSSLASDSAKKYIDAEIRQLGEQLKQHFDARVRAIDKKVMNRLAKLENDNANRHKQITAAITAKFHLTPTRSAIEKYFVRLPNKSQEPPQHRIRL